MKTRSHPEKALLHSTRTAPFLGVCVLVAAIVLGATETQARAGTAAPKKEAKTTPSWTLTVGSVSANTGDLIEVPVELLRHASAADAGAAIAFQVSYDPAVLRPHDGTGSDLAVITDPILTTWYSTHLGYNTAISGNVGVVLYGRSITTFNDQLDNAENQFDHSGLGASQQHNPIPLGVLRFDVLGPRGSSSALTFSDLSVAAVGAVDITSTFVVANGQVSVPPPPPTITTDGGNGPGSDYATNSESLLLEGTCEPTFSEVRVNDSTTGVVYTLGQTSWSYVGSLTEGANPFSVTGVNSASNLSAATTITITLDTEAPNAPAVTGAALTNTPKPEWSWTPGGGDGIGTYRYKLDSSELTAGATETTSAGYTPDAGLDDGSHTLYVQERDRVGNWSATGNWTITVDTKPPSAPVITSDGGAGPGAGFTTTASSANLVGTADSSASLLQVNGSSSGVTYTPGAAAWQFTSSLVFDENAFVVTAIDAAGNVSAPATIHVQRIPEVIVYVNPLGNDGAGDGTLAHPWRTIGFAMNTVGPFAADDRRITIHLANGVYSEKVLFSPHVSIVGPDESAPESAVVQFFDSADPAGPSQHVVMTAAEDTEIRDLTLTFPSGTILPNVVLLRIDNALMTVSNVVFDGNNVQNSTGVTAAQPGSSASVIQYSVIKDLKNGVSAQDSGISITRNLFDAIANDAVIAQPFAGKADTGVSTPLLGRSDDPSSGFNRFRVVAGAFVHNTTSDQIVAEFNDWGVYTALEIETKLLTTGKTVAESIDYAPWLGAAIEPGTIALMLLDGATYDQIPDPTSPDAWIGSIHAERDPISKLFLFSNVAPGTYIANANASGYVPAEQVFTLGLKEILSLRLEMTEKRVTGDINGGGVVNAVDVQLVINAALGLNIGEMDADVDENGKVNAVDVQLVINGALGL